MMNSWWAGFRFAPLQAPQFRCSASSADAHLAVEQRFLFSGLLLSGFLLSGVLLPDICL
jgi:hypothetical protein